ncbi:MAG: ABC transporter ATP-binding protein [Proteobacteria bacterium]|nr:ABC transporter ATP-binding protein [Pseudomonadota bacterium]
MVEGDTVEREASRPVLRVEGLTTHFELPRRTVRAVEDVNLEVHRGETVCIVGESGSGKSVTGLSILRLVPKPGRIVSGRIELDGQNLLDLSPARMEKIRGPGVTMVFQNPRAALDPFFTIGDQLVETASVQMGLKRREARIQAKEFLSAVRVPQIDRIMAGYSHQLSGGECQRVMIAMALMCQPKVLIADEPTSALDAKVQSELLALLIELKNEFKMTIILITHDFGVVAEMAERVNVMYAGRIVETGAAKDVLSSPQHPYTIGLLESVPKVGERSRRLKQIEGQPPDPSALPPGCAFAPRCPERVPFCERVEPRLEPVSRERLASCHLRGDLPPELEIPEAST